MPHPQLLRLSPTERRRPVKLGVVDQVVERLNGAVEAPVLLALLVEVLDGVVQPRQVSGCAVVRGVAGGPCGTPAEVRLRQVLRQRERGAIVLQLKDTRLEGRFECHDVRLTV